jgi:hypothetical protein
MYRPIAFFIFYFLLTSSIFSQRNLDTMSTAPIATQRWPNAGRIVSQYATDIATVPLDTSNGTLYMREGIIYTYSGGCNFITITRISVQKHSSYAQIEGNGVFDCSEIMLGGFLNLKDDSSGFLVYLNRKAYSWELVKIKHPRKKGKATLVFVYKPYVFH